MSYANIKALPPDRRWLATIGDTAPFDPVAAIEWIRRWEPPPPSLNAYAMIVSHDTYVYLTTGKWPVR
jgi:hypothetical protein